MRSAVPQKFRSGNAARNLLANARTASRPRSGACSEYSNRMSGAASSSMTAGSKSLPQNSVNHRPTTALLSSIDMDRSLSRHERLRSLSERAPRRRDPMPSREMAARTSGKLARRDLTFGLAWSVCGVCEANDYLARNGSFERKAMPVVPYYLGRSAHVWTAESRAHRLDSQSRINAQAQQDCAGDPLDPRHRDHLQALGSDANRHGRNGPQAQRAAGEYQEWVITGGQVRRRDLGYVSPLGQEYDSEAGGANPPERGRPADQPGRV